MNIQLCRRMTQLLVAGGLSTAALSAVALSIQPGSIPTDTWVGFCFGLPGSAASPTPCVPGGYGNPFTFSLASPELLKVTDIAEPGDTFNVYDGTTLLFATPTVANSSATNLDPNFTFGNNIWSSGSTLLGAGNYSINIFANASPYGGGGAFLGVFAAAVPEPQTYALLLAGMALMTFATRRRRLL